MQKKILGILLTLCMLLGLFPFTVGTAALAAALIVSLFVMGPAKLSGLRKDAQRAFRSGVSEKYVASVYNDIRTAADSADTLAGVCGLTLGTEDEGVKTLSSIAAELRETDDEETMLRRFKAVNFTVSLRS